MVTICDDVCGKGKDEFISGTSTCQAKCDSKFRAWNSENYMVMSWLINTMTTEITAQRHMGCNRDTYSSKDNISELFAIESNLVGTFDVCNLDFEC